MPHRKPQLSGKDSVQKDFAYKDVMDNHQQGKSREGGEDSGSGGGWVDGDGNEEKVRMSIVCLLVT